MKCYKRFLCALLVCALSFGLFSPLTANASDEGKAFNFHHQQYVDSTRVNNVNGQSGYDLWTSKAWNGYYTIQSFRFAWSIYPVDGTLVAKSGETIDIVVNNVLLKTKIESTGQEYIWRELDRINFALMYSDGTYDFRSINYVYSDASGYGYFKAENVDCKKDVSRIILSAYWSPYEALGLTGFESTFLISGGLYPANFDVVVHSKEVGLLTGILNKTQGLLDSITELPNKLWNLIKDGLVSLFVPDEDYIIEYKDKWEQLLSDRFGAIWQVCDIVVESWERVMEADETNVVSMPKVTIPLPDSNEFSFGGYDVKLIPDQFDTLVYWVKMIIGIVCTIAFINGLLKRYDEVMGVEQ